MKRQLLIPAIIITLLLGIGAGLLLRWPGGALVGSGRGVPQELGEAPRRGAETPKVVIHELSDYQCPFCSKAALEIMAQVERKYEGEVALVFHNNPLAMHPLAMPAAKAALAAGIQGKFWEMHDWLFSNREGLSDERIETGARALGLNMDRFAWDMDDPRIEHSIRSDQWVASQMGIQATPVFVIHGRVVQGAQPLENFAAIIDEELAKANQALAEGTPVDQLEEFLSTKNQAHPAFIAHWVKGEPAPIPLNIEKKKPVTDSTVRTLTVAEGDVTIGPSNAPVTLTLFCDFQCPYCRRSTGLVEALLTRFPKEVRFVYKHYPLPFHPVAKPAAEAFQFAALSGKAWELHDAIYANQKGLTKEGLVQLAAGIGLDTVALLAALDSGAHAGVVNRHMAEAEGASVRGTPSMFLNGRALESRSLEEISKAITEESRRPRTIALK